MTLPFELELKQVQFKFNVIQSYTLVICGSMCGTKKELLIIFICTVSVFCALSVKSAKQKTNVDLQYMK